MTEICCFFEAAQIWSPVLSKPAICTSSKITSGIMTSRKSIASVIVERITSNPSPAKKTGGFSVFVHYRQLVYFFHSKLWLVIIQQYTLYFNISIFVQLIILYNRIFSSAVKNKMWLSSSAGLCNG